MKFLIGMSLVVLSLALYISFTPKGNEYVGVWGDGGSSASISLRNGIPYILMSGETQHNLEFTLIDEEPWMFVNKGNKSIAVNLYEAAKRYAALGPYEREE